MSGRKRLSPDIGVTLRAFLLGRGVLSRPVLLFCVGRPSVVVKHGRGAVRRVGTSCIRTGGVRVIHHVSKKNTMCRSLNGFSFYFVAGSSNSSFHSFKGFAGPIVSFLRDMNIGRTRLGKEGSLIVKRGGFSKGTVCTAGKEVATRKAVLFSSSLSTVADTLGPHGRGVRSGKVGSVHDHIAGVGPFISRTCRGLAARRFHSLVLLSVFSIRAHRRMGRCRLASRS